MILHLQSEDITDKNFSIMCCVCVCEIRLDFQFILRIILV